MNGSAISSYIITSGHYGNIGVNSFQRSDHHFHWTLPAYFTHEALWLDDKPLHEVNTKHTRPLDYERGKKGEVNAPCWLQRDRYVCIEEAKGHTCVLYNKLLRKSIRRERVKRGVLTG